MKRSGRKLVPLVGAFVQWREDLIGLDSVLALAACAPLASHRAALLDHGVERFVFHAPENFTPSRLERLAELFQHLPRYKYVLYALAGRPDLLGSLAPKGDTAAPRAVPVSPRAAAADPDPTGLPAAGGPQRGDGPGGRPRAARAVAAGAPRRESRADRHARHAAEIPLRQPARHDDPDQGRGGGRSGAPGTLRWRHRVLPARVATVQPSERAPRQRRQAAHGPPASFLVQGDMGRVQRSGLASGHSSSTRMCSSAAATSPASKGSIARRSRPATIQATGSSPSSGSPAGGRGATSITLTPDRDSARRTPSASGRSSLPPGEGPIALVNPFGEAAPSRGFYDKTPRSPPSSRGSSRKGYRLVVLPQDSKWARPAAIESALAASEYGGPRSHPDGSGPANADVETRLALTERPDLPSKDRVVRLFKYFASYADLIVTVEGWLAHLAYLLGRPFRLFVAAGSFDSSWFPHGRGPDAAPGFRAVPPRAPHALTLGASRPRRSTPGAALPAEGAPRDGPGRHSSRSGSPDAAPTLRRALASPDSTVRRWAIAALGRLDPIGNKADLIRALGDPGPRSCASPPTRCSEATSTAAVSWDPGTGPSSRPTWTERSENWDAVTRVGPSALPVLFQPGEGRALRRAVGRQRRRSGRCCPGGCQVSTDQERRPRGTHRETKRPPSESAGLRPGPPRNPLFRDWRA